MGGAVSSGQNNDELVDNLKEANYIKTPLVERVFRVVDRAHYYLPECRDNAYKDLAWKNGTLHLSAPCIYSEVMEALELRPGLSFLNLGSGTGYLNTMVGFMIGPYGINHGIELHTDNVSYAHQKLESFIQTSFKFDDLELCEPQFVVGNCMNLAPDNRLYDRVYCGASCPSEQLDLIQNMIKINGILVIPIGDQLLKIKRINEREFSTESVLPVSFASLVLPPKSDNQDKLIVLPEVNPMSLQGLCRYVIREAIRQTFDFSLPADDPLARTRKGKRFKSNNFLRSESGRFPLNIVPTAQGLMLLATFDSSDEGDDETRIEPYRGSRVTNMRDLGQQLRRHAAEYPSRGQSSRTDTDEIDSDLSEMEEDRTQQNSYESEEKDVNGNKNSLIISKTNVLAERQDDIMDITDGKNTELASSKTSTAFNMEDADRTETSSGSILEKTSGAAGSSNGNTSARTAGRTYERITDKIFTIMSSKKRERERSEDNDHTNGPTPRSMQAPDSFQAVSRQEPDSSQAASRQEPGSWDTSLADFSQRSPAIQVTASLNGSVSGTTSESYSTSADTSETSGFGSLGEDTHHMTSHLSTLGSLKDEMEVSSEDIVPAPSVSSSKRSPQSKSSIEESSLDYDSLTADSGDTAWVDTDEDEGHGDDDDSDDSLDHHSQRTFKKQESGTENDGCPQTGKSATDAADADGRSQPRGPSFSAYLKLKVETLPLPASLKAFILHYRKVEEAIGL